MLKTKLNERKEQISATRDGKWIWHPKCLHPDKLQKPRYAVNPRPAVSWNTLCSQSQPLNHLYLVNTTTYRKLSVTLRNVSSDNFRWLDAFIKPQLFAPFLATGRPTDVIGRRVSVNAASCCTQFGVIVAIFLFSSIYSCYAYYMKFRIILSVEEFWWRRRAVMCKAKTVVDQSIYRMHGASESILCKILNPDVLLVCTVQKIDSWFITWRNRTLAFLIIWVIRMQYHMQPFSVVIRGLRSNATITEFMEYYLFCLPFPPDSPPSHSRR
jgi:hypothetical protein